MQNSPESQLTSPPISGGPLATEVSKTLVSGETPLDFIKKNLKATKLVSTPARVERTPEQSGSTPVTNPMLEEPKAAPPPPAAELEDPLGLFTEAPPEKVVAPTVAEPEAPLDPKEESLTVLRKRANEYKTQADQKEQELVSAREELERYKSGEAIPEVIQQKEERISQLEQYEALHNFKLSPEFQKKFVEPRASVEQKAVGLATKYGVDPAVLNQAFGIQNIRDQNAFLKQYFDEVGTVEVREVLSALKDIDIAAEEALAKPKVTFEKIKEELGAARATEETSRLNTIRSNANVAWLEASREIQESGNFPELTLTGDETSDAVVRPVIKSAASEFGKYVKLLADAGIRELPKDAAKILAKVFQQAHGHALAAASRADHHERAERVLATAKRQAPLLRPPIGGVANAGAVSSQRRQETPEEAGKRLAQIGVERAKQKAAGR